MSPLFSVLFLITNLNSSLVLLLFVNHGSFVSQFSFHYFSLPLSMTLPPAHTLNSTLSLTLIKVLDLFLKKRHSEVFTVVSSVA